MSAARALADDHGAREGGECREGEVLEALESGRAYASLSLSLRATSEGDEEIDLMESLGVEEHQYEVSEDWAVLAPGCRGDVLQRRAATS